MTVIYPFRFYRLILYLLLDNTKMCLQKYKILVSGWCDVWTWTLALIQQNCKCYAIG